MTFALFAFLFAPSGGDNDPRRISSSKEDDSPPADHQWLQQQDRLLGYSNAKIIERIAAGDVKIFTQLFDAYASPLARWAYLTTGDGTLAEDVVADVFTRIWERRGKWIVHRTVEAYLFNAVRTRARDIRRIDSRRAELLRRYSTGDEIPGYAGAASGIDAGAENDERRAQLLQALNSLPVRQREAIFARWYRGMSYEEVGVVLNISSLAARQLVFRALSALRMRIQDVSKPD